MKKKKINSKEEEIKTLAELNDKLFKVNEKINNENKDLKIDINLKNIEIGNLNKKITEMEKINRNDGNNEDLNTNKIRQLEAHIKKITNENMALKRELDENKIKIEGLTKKIYELGNNSNIINDSENIKRLTNELNEKTQIIENLNNQLKGSIRYDDIKDGDKIIAINFTSSDSQINFPLICKASMVFAEVERKLYERYPEYGLNEGENNLFLGNGIRIGRLQTIAEIGFTGYAITIMKMNN